MRRGNPVVALTMPPEEVELLDLFQGASDAQTRSEALRRIIRFAFGHNSVGVSVTDELEPGTKLDRIEERREALLAIWADLDSERSPDQSVEKEDTQ